MYRIETEIEMEQTPDSESREHGLRRGSANQNTIICRLLGNLLLDPSQGEALN